MFANPSSRSLVPVALLALITIGNLPAQAQPNEPVVITVDVAADRHPINPLIYGASWADGATAKALNLSLNRMGGNHTSRYNWKLNATNRGRDWFFQSTPSDDPAPGADADALVANSLNNGAQPMITVPALGWVARLGENRGKLASFSIAKYGPQKSNDAQWMPDAGDGLAPDGKPIEGNDPHDAHQVADAEFQQGWIAHLVERWKPAAQGGVPFYIVDDEPSLWHGTHRDVHPAGATGAEVRDDILKYSVAIKAVDPGAQVVGPEEWGWSGYFHSGADQQWGNKNGWANLPDRAARGNTDYLPWLLQELRKSDEKTGKRSLDVFSVHYFPQGGEYSEDVSPAMQLKRNRSTRALWDADYTDESWIGDKVRLIPRLKEWVAAYNPGLRVALTEYNWGAENHINGATAQADILGILGREGLDMATRWEAPKPESPVFKAFQMYRNYDGKDGSFGETSVRATAPNPDEVAAFASLRAQDGALTVMLDNKRLTGTASVKLAIQNFAAGTDVQLWQLTQANEIKRQPDLKGAAALNLALPAQSISLLVAPNAAK